MNNSGILTLIRNVQRLYGEIAALLRTYDKLLDARGYKCMSGSSVVEAKKTLDQHNLWAPSYMYRVYAYKDDIVVVNIVLDCPDEPDRVDQPLLISSRFQYKKGFSKKEAGPWDAWDLWFYGPQKEVDRVYYKDKLALSSKEFLENSGWDKDFEDKVNNITFLIARLESLTDSRVLESTITKLFS